MSKFAKIYGIVAIVFLGLFIGSMFISIPNNPVATLIIRLVGILLFVYAALWPMALRADDEFFNDKLITFLLVISIVLLVAGFIYLMLTINISKSEIFFGMSVDEVFKASGIKMFFHLGIPLIYVVYAGSAFLALLFLENDAAWHAPFITELPSFVITLLDVLLAPVVLIVSFISILGITIVSGFVNWVKSFEPAMIVFAVIGLIGLIVGIILYFVKVEGEENMLSIRYLASICISLFGFLFIVYSIQNDDCWWTAFIALPFYITAFVLFQLSLSNDAPALCVVSDEYYKHNFEHIRALNILFGIAVSGSFITGLFIGAVSFMSKWPLWVKAILSIVLAPLMILICIIYRILHLLHRVGENSVS